MRRTLIALSLLSTVACGEAERAVFRPSGIPRADFNRRAAELDLPIFWRASDQDGVLDPAELAVLWGERQAELSEWVRAGAFTPRMNEAWKQLEREVDFSGVAPEERRRREAVLEELAQGRPSLVETDLSVLSAEDRAILASLFDAALIVERIYARQNGVDRFDSVLATLDPASRQLFWRNQGPFCQAPKTERNPDCSALPSRPTKISGLYPAAIQSGTDTRFCQLLEARPDADALLGPFTVVVARPGGRSTGDAATDDLDAVPYHVAYREEMEQVAVELDAAAAAIADPQEVAFRSYLTAAAAAFRNGDWPAADEAWAAMSATNSKWYLRVGPDEVYFEPCSRKAGFHMMLARIDPESLQWQQRLDPLKQPMEQALAALAGPPYATREVSFHLPDFLDTVLNAADDRYPLGSTVGQSLPNWGPVANEGRGRTVAIVDLFTDGDSERAWKTQTSSLLCKESADRAPFDPDLSVMSTVLHEAAHNLGPAHEYRVAGRTDDQVFGGPLASTLEELKAQTSALYFADWLAERGVIERSEADGAHLRDVAWAFSRVSEGMYTAEGKPKNYPQLAAVQLGWLLEAGVLSWAGESTAANGADRGCFAVDLARWPGAVQDLTRTVLQIKGSGDRERAEQLLERFVDDPGPWAELREIIAERWLREPKASFVYSIVS